jgi:serine/threonine protein kinase
MHATLPFLLLNILEIIDTIDKNAEAALVAAARKELAYLKQFSRPLLLFQRERRETYGYEEQSPSGHIKNLEHYLFITSSLVSKNSALHHFHIRHPDLKPSNIIMSKSSDCNQLKIVGLPNWQHASILPPFLLAGIPGRLQNYDDPVSQALIPPSLPANMVELDQSKQNYAMGLYQCRLVHFHYVKNTKEYNKLHHDALSDPMSMFICRLFDQAAAPWEGETHALKTTLIEATEIWGRLITRVRVLNSIVWYLVRYSYLWSDCNASAPSVGAKPARSRPAWLLWMGR